MRPLLLLLAALLLLLGTWWGLRVDSPVLPVAEPSVSAWTPGDDVPPGTTPVFGFVFDATDGRPVVGATLRGRTERGDLVSGMTDSRGRYVLFLAEGVRCFPDLGVRAAGYFETQSSRDNVTAAGRAPTVFLERIQRMIPGRVVDHLLRPVAGATVGIKDEDPRASDAQGGFGLVPVGRRCIFYDAWTDQHAFTSGEWYATDGIWPDELVIRLDSTAPTAVLVVDGEGRPVAGAVVRRYHEEWPLRLRTGADGAVAFPLVPYEGEMLVATEGERVGKAPVRGGGSARIVIRSPDDPAFRPLFDPSCASPLPEPPGSPVDPAYVPRPEPPPPPVLRRVEFLVTTPDGKSLPGADLSVRWRLPAYGMNFLHRSAEELTDEEGRCSLQVPAGITCRISGWWGELYSGGREVRLPVQGDLPLEILVLKVREPDDYNPETDPEPVPNPVRVLVLDAAGLPVPGAQVSGIDMRGMERTGSDGVAVWPAEDPEASVRLCVELPGNPDLWATGAPGGPPMVVRLPPRGSIRIRLNEEHLDARESPDFVIFSSEFQRREILNHRVSGFTREEGSSIRIDCPAGTWPLVFGMEPGESVLYPRVTVRGGEETILTYDFPRFPGAELRTLDPLGMPVKGALVCVAETLAGDVVSGSGGETNVSHGFRFCAMPIGPGHLLVHSDGFAPAVHGPFDLWAPLHLDLRLRVGAKVRARLQNPSGDPVDGLVGWQPAGGPLYVETYTTDDDGAFTLLGLLPEGAQTLVVLIEGREPVKQVVQVPLGGEIEVTIVVP